MTGVFIPDISPKCQALPRQEGKTLYLFQNLLENKLADRHSLIPNLFTAKQCFE